MSESYARWAMVMCWIWYYHEVTMRRVGKIFFFFQNDTLTVCAQRLWPTLV